MSAEAAVVSKTIQRFKDAISDALRFATDDPMAYIAGDFLAKYVVFQQFFKNPVNAHSFDQIINDFNLPLHRRNLEIINGLNTSLTLANFNEHLRKQEYQQEFFGNGEGSANTHEDGCKALRTAHTMYNILLMLD